MVPTGVLEICHASQYDIGREIRFDLINGTDDFVLSGDEDITIFMRDFKGNLIVSSAPNTSSNYVVWTSSEGELDVSGPAICELRVTKDDDVLGSANYIMEIDADPYDGIGVHVETVGPADICTFETTLPEPLQSVLVNVEATGGNGTPDNPIPINGYTEANITANGNTYTIAFGQTVYGGVLDVTRGKLKPCIEYPSYNGETLSGRWLSSEAKYIEGTTPPIGSQVVSLDDYGSDIDLTPEVISAVVGTNNVFADCGETTVKYLKAGD